MLKEDQRAGYIRGKMLAFHMVDTSIHYRHSDISKRFLIFFLGYKYIVCKRLGGKTCVWWLEFSQIKPFLFVTHSFDGSFNAV